MQRMMKKKQPEHETTSGCQIQKEKKKKKNNLTDARLDCDNMSKDSRNEKLEATHTCDLLRTRTKCKGDIITTILIGQTELAWPLFTYIMYLKKSTTLSGLGLIFDSKVVFHLFVHADISPRWIGGYKPNAARRIGVSYAKMYVCRRSLKCSEQCMTVYRKGSFQLPTFSSKTRPI